MVKLCVVVILMAKILVSFQFKTKLQEECEAVGELAVYYGTSCYVRSVGNSYYNKIVSKDLCKLNGKQGFLAMPSTKPVYDVLVKLLQDNGGLCAITALKRDTSTTKYWYWTAGRTPWIDAKMHKNYAFWAPNQPKVYSGSHICHQLCPTGLSTIWCGSLYGKRRYLCQFVEPHMAKFKLFAQDLMGNGANTIEQHTSTESECAAKCRYLAICQGFSHNEQSGECRLHFVHGDHPKKNGQKDGPGYVFYDKL